MARKSNESCDNELEKIRDRLKILNQKVKKYASHPADQTSKMKASQASQALPENVSLGEMRDKLHVINEYLKRQMSNGNRKPSVQETTETSVHSALKTIPEPVKDPSEEKVTLGLHLVDEPRGKIASERLGVGLDLGTSYLVTAREMEGKHVFVKSERNAFLSLRYERETRELLEKLKIKYASLGNHMYILGNHSLNLANMFNREVQRSMSLGILNPSEVQSIPIIKLIVEHILWPPREGGEICCFSIPASPIDKEQDTIYHKGVFDEILKGLGFETITVDEGYAVILAELGDKDFTGIGISCGGGMANVCAAYKSVPILSFSITRGGDWIDKGAASVLGISSTKATMIKEQGISLKSPNTRKEEAIAIYYKNYIRYFLESLARVFGDGQDTPQFKEPVDMVFAGGTSLPDEFMNVVKEELQSIEFGFPLGDIRRAEEPLTSVSRGCLFHAINSDKRND